MGKIELIYEILIRGLILRKDIMNAYGITDDDINDLIKEEKIIKENEEKFKLLDIEGMYRYGVKLCSHRYTHKAINCFRSCYQLDNQNRKVCLQLMLLELKRNNFMGAKSFFKQIEKIEPEKYAEDNNLYLFLLGTLMFRDQEYQERINDLEPKDVLIPEDKECNNKDESNEIRKTIFKKKYKYAMKLLNDLMHKEFKFNIELELLKELLNQTIILDSKFKTSISNATSSKDYKRLVEVLLAKSENQYLSNMETYILVVAKNIISILSTNVIPTKTIENTTYLYTALKENNFELAKEINLKFLKERKQNPETDILNILLTDLIEIIKEKSIKLDLTNEEELANYIKQNRMTLEQAKKEFFILNDEMLIIKLIYARDYYLNNEYELGNQLLDEVISANSYSEKVIRFIQELKVFKENNPQVKKRTLN